MKKFLNKTISTVFLIFSLAIFPVNAFASQLAPFNSYFLAAQQKTIINYEKSQPSAIDNPVVDPNFNVMRSSDMDSSFASYIVIALVVIASIVPLATWFFSRSRTN